MSKLARAPLAILNRVGDKESARREWRENFNNRAPASRQPKALQVKAIAADTTEILLLAEIGWFGITAKQFSETLSAVSTPKIVVRISSGGGDVFDGLAIHNALKAHAAEVSVVIEGIAASIASIIAMAGDTISIHESAMVMIHKAWALAIGNETDMADMAKVLAKIDGQLAAVYAKQTGKSAEEMLALMAGDSDGTWFTSDEAAAIGLVDEVIKDAEPDDTMARLQAMRRRLALAEQD